MDSIIVMVLILVGVFILTYSIYGKYIITENMSEEEQSNTNSQSTTNEAITGIQTSITGIQTSITALQSQTGNLQSQMTSLSTKYDSLSSTVSELQNSSASSTESLNNINSEISSGQDTLGDNFDSSAFQ